MFINLHLVFDMSQPPRRQLLHFKVITVSVLKMQMYKLCTIRDCSHSKKARSIVKYNGIMSLRNYATRVQIIDVLRPDWSRVIT